tara:strand:+ start:565 stop:828 length:264 start_codon:yes stop_codon:yes gene_type:complete
MIDTDKYEGHIENIGRWQMFANALPRWAEDADRKLVSDAPLLLAEVKRLREQLLQGVMYMHMTTTQTKDGRIYNAKKFERQVKELIE